MAILAQIRKDADFLRDLISNLTSEKSVVTADGVRLFGEKLEEILSFTRAENKAELRRLELILESGIIPDEYYSIISKKTYFPSPEELKQQSIPLPPAKHSFFPLKISRKVKENKLNNSHFNLIRDDETSVINFFIEHKDDKSYPKGACASRVKKGYMQSDNSELKYAIKIFHKNLFTGDTIHELRLAMRAAYCYRQLGREGYAFRRNEKQYLVTEWLNGANVSVANQKQIQSIPIPRRIVMAISLLRELSILHKLGFIHNDIKPDNVIVNFGSLNFVDLDSVRPKNEVPLDGLMPIFTTNYLPTAQLAYDAIHHTRGFYMKFNEQTDMYAMGLTLIHLFQEIYIPKNEACQIPVNGSRVDMFIFNTFSLAHGPQYNAHSALQKLLKSMVSREQEELITADHYIESLKKILSTYPEHERYLHEDRLVNLSSNPFSKDEGENAFKEIEIELLGFNKRLDNIKRRFAIRDSLSSILSGKPRSIVAEYDNFPTARSKL